MERHQSWIYLCAILAGLGSGSVFPASAAHLEVLLWPTLGCLLYATFTQVPLTRLPGAFSDWRFMGALLTGNFLLIPALVWLLLVPFSLEAPVRLGVLLVLLVPCTDWFISFVYLGKGDSARAIAATPIMLLLQLIALPAYLWLFMGDVLLDINVGNHLLTAFAGLILLPLILAWVTEGVAYRSRAGGTFVQWLGWLPVPLLAVVVFIIAASQVTTVGALLGVLWQVVLVYLLYLVMTLFLGKWLGRLFRLSPPAARTLTFSLGTRNSFVVLPLALALPAAWEATVVVIVVQSLVELFGMTAWVTLVPRWVIPDKTSRRSSG